MCTSTMYQMELPHVNILSKIDIAIKHKSKLLFNLDYYTDVLSLDHLLSALQNDPLTSRYKYYKLKLLFKRLHKEANHQIKCR